MAVKNYIYDYSKSEQDGGKELITRSNDLVKEMEHEVEKYTKLLQLAKADRVRVVKNNVDYMHYDYSINSATKWHRMINSKTEKIDKRKNYPEKDMYEYFVCRLKDDFFGDRDFKITNFVSGGYEQYYVSVELECKDIVFALEIPILQNITVNNIEDANYGKLVLLVKTSECSWTRVAASYTEEDIKKAIISWLDEDELAF